MSTFHSVYSNANSLTNLLDEPRPSHNTTPTSSSHPELHRVSREIQTDGPTSPLDTKEPILSESTVFQLAPPPAAKPRPPQTIVTNSKDNLLYCYDNEEEGVAPETFTTFKAARKPIGEIVTVISTRLQHLD